MKKTYSELTNDLYRRLCGRFIEEYANKVILIHTVDERSWAHPAILSYFEVVAIDCRNIRLAAYTNSQTTENMRKRGKVTLSVFDERLAAYIKGTATELCAQMRSAPHNSKLNVFVEQVLIDSADPVLEPGAYITSGIRYQNPNAGSLGVLQELLLH